MDEFFSSGRVVDLALAVMVLEWLLFASIRRSRRWAVDHLLALLPGACLLLALRLAMVDAHWSWVAAALTAALLTHLVDLSRRWRP